MKTNQEIEPSKNVHSDYNGYFTALAKAGVAVVLCIIAMVCYVLITFGSFLNLIFATTIVCPAHTFSLSSQLGYEPCLLFQFSVGMLISLLLFMLSKTCETIALQLLRGESLTLAPIFHRFSRNCMLFCLSFIGCYIFFFVLVYRGFSFLSWFLTWLYD